MVRGCWGTAVRVSCAENRRYSPPQHEHVIASSLLMQLSGEIGIEASSAIEDSSRRFWGVRLFIVPTRMPNQIRQLEGVIGRSGGNVSL